MSKHDTNWQPGDVQAVPAPADMYGKEAQPAEAEGSVEMGSDAWMALHLLDRLDVSADEEPRVQQVEEIVRRMGAALSAVTAERDRLREEVERIALENDGHDQRRIRWAEELKQLRAEVERLREAELLLLSVCNDLMRHENADVRMVTCIELNNWLTRRAAMDAKEE